MQRVSVVGCPGSGKSSVARRLSGVLGAPCVELDALHWGPDWSAPTDEEFRVKVRAATSGDTWIVDGNYQNKIGTLVWERADTVVWVNPSRWTVMWRVLCRTVRRVLTRQELWSGNREDWRALAFWRGEDSILWWAWTSYAHYEELYASAMREEQNRPLVFHHLRTAKQVNRFLKSLEQAPATSTLDAERE